MVLFVEKSPVAEHVRGNKNWNSNGVPERSRRRGGRPTGFRRAPLVFRQPASKPGSGWRTGGTRARDGHSSRTPVTRRLKQPTRTAGSGHRPWSFCFRGSAPSLFGLAPGGVCRAAGVAAGAVRSYRPVSPLPRHYLTQPRRSVLCGTVPRLAPAGCYPAPPVHGARTFLPGDPARTFRKARTKYRSGRPAD